MKYLPAALLVLLFFATSSWLFGDAAPPAATAASEESGSDLGALGLSIAPVASTPSATTVNSPTPSATLTPCATCLELRMPLLRRDASPDDELASPSPTPTLVPGTTTTPTSTATTGELPARTLDSRLSALGVYIEEANVPAGEPYWRVIEILWRDEQEANGGHAIRWDILDEEGLRLISQPATVSWSGGSTTILTEAKPPWEYTANFPMYSAGCSYSLSVDGLPSDRIHCMGLGDLTRRDWTIHVEYHIKFQRVVQGLPATTTPTPSATSVAVTPTPTGTPGTGSGSYSGAVVQTLPNCGLTQVFGVVHDASGNPLPGARLRLTWDAADAQIFYTRAGDYVRPETDASGWEFYLNNYPVANTWRVAVVDETGNVLGQDLSVWTDGHCETDAANAVKVHFQAQPGSRIVPLPSDIDRPRRPSPLYERTPLLPESFRTQ